jgi:hypothetical protein
VPDEWERVLALLQSLIDAGDDAQAGQAHDALSALDALRSADGDAQRALATILRAPQ